MTISPAGHWRTHGSGSMFSWRSNDARKLCVRGVIDMDPTRASYTGILYRRNKIIGISCESAERNLHRLGTVESGMPKTCGLLHVAPCVSACRELSGYTGILSEV